MLNVTFFGTRAAPPAAPERSGRYGRHTACVALEVPRRDALLCDLGTGAQGWAAALDPGSPRRAAVLLSRPDAHHVSGMPVLDPGELDVFGPPFEGVLPGIRYTRVEDEELAVGEASVTVRSVPHDGPANGYRIECEGVRVAYVGDHGAPPTLDTVAAAVLELADGVDLLVHDTGGSSTVEYALLVARESRARRLVLFHHGAERDDEDLDRILAGARRRAERMGVDEVLAAAEGTTVSFERDAR